MKAYELHLGDCLGSLRGMADNSVDAIVTDPPYGLSFMGKKWDYDVPSVDVWRECLRVLKPGGHLLAFAGTRTQHRMAVRIEDAGFEIRDMIAWVYGSGFPKSLDVSKAIDKKANELPVFDAIRAHIREWRDRKGYDNKALNEAAGSSTSGCGMARHWTSEEGGQHAIPSKDQWRKLKALLGWPDCEFDAIYDVVKDGAERPVIGRGTSDALAFYAERAPVVGYAITAPATDAARQWQGWGTALKPALEPITVARKPLVGTVAENVLAHGTGAINVDACRIESGGEHIVKGVVTKRTTVSGDERDGAALGMYGAGASFTPTNHPAGRWPANLIFSDDPEVVGVFPADRQGATSNSRSKSGNAVYGEQNAMPKTAGRGDTGSAARFFKQVSPEPEDLEAARLYYCAKASKRDRDDGLDGFGEKDRHTLSGGAMVSEGRTAEKGKGTGRNIHPTVKPTDLMRYLCRLVTPPGGVVLDPFMGSGSTGKAAMLEGFRFVGCELSPEYLAIAEARIMGARPRNEVSKTIKPAENRDHYTDDLFGEAA